MTIEMEITSVINGGTWRVDSNEREVEFDLLFYWLLLSSNCTHTHTRTRFAYTRIEVEELNNIYKKNKIN